MLTPAPGKGPADFQQHIVAEEVAVWAAYKAGTIRELYLQPEPLTVSLVFEAASHADVEAELAKFPMIQAGLLVTHLTTLGPWLPLEDQALYARVDPVATLRALLAKGS